VARQIDVKIGSAILEGSGIPCNSNETVHHTAIQCNAVSNSEDCGWFLTLQVLELIRGIRVHFGSFVKGLADGNLEKAQLGLGHSYSRAKVGLL
jgi:nucleolar protein 56